MKQLAFEPKRMMKEFRVYDTGIRKIRVGHDMDGGYVLLDHLLRRRSNGVAYSYGIGREVSWDLEMAEKFGFEVFQYDPTVEGPAVEHERFRFHQQGVAGLPANGQPKLTDPLRLKKRPAKSLTDHLRANGHANRNDLIMKMDVEGYEWEVFDSETEATLRCFGQIVVEVHCLATARMYREFALILAKMNRIFRVCHVHANNFGR
ncbi:MAG: FkbM family methyltransferase, partial [Bdellovibrionota bacterium]